MGDKPLKHLLEVIVFGLAVTLGMENAVVDGPVLPIVTCGVNQVD